MGKLCFTQAVEVSDEAVEFGTYAGAFGGITDTFIVVAHTHSLCKTVELGFDANQARCMPGDLNKLPA